MKDQFPVNGLILAAGKGSRMKSSLPKVLHLAKGRTLLERVAASLRHSGVQELAVILNENTAPFEDFIKQNQNITFCIQSSQNGTGDAVASVAYGIKGITPPSYNRGRLLHGGLRKSYPLLIAPGDCPLLRPEVIESFLRQCLDSGCDLGLIAMKHPEPFGYGRVIMDSQGGFEKIVEEKDATSEERKIMLCNTGIIFAKVELLFQILGGLESNNAANEYYLTDVFSLGKKKNAKITVFETEDYESFVGVNTQEQLAFVESRLAH
jgi:bifunctional UDP-N-acetylglucosamine pyrophosphorylase/glucosamine-1-phosphate N-acetyltransferase